MGGQGHGEFSSQNGHRKHFQRSTAASEMQTRRNRPDNSFSMAGWQSLMSRQFDVTSIAKTSEL
jgi:hypothetical protein